MKIVIIYIYCTEVNGVTFVNDFSLHNTKTSMEDFNHLVQTTHGHGR